MVKKIFYIALAVFSFQCHAKVCFVNPVLLNAELSTLAQMLENAENQDKQLKREERDKLEEQFEKTKKKIVLLATQKRPLESSIRSLVEHGEAHQTIQALKKEKVRCYFASNCQQCLDEVELKEQEIYEEHFKKSLNTFCAAYPHDLSVKAYIQTATEAIEIFNQIAKRYNDITDKKK